MERLGFDVLNSGSSAIMASMYIIIIANLQVLNY